MSATKRILGIDPGFDRTGFGIVDMRGSDAVWVHHECVQTSAADSFSRRLQIVRDRLQQVIEIYKPHAVGVEQLFFQSNAKTAIKVGMARGVMLLVLEDAGLQLVEMTPNQVKNGLTGWGNADKKQVQEMVKRFLKLTEIPKPDDAADALAIAIVGGLMVRM